MKSSFYLSYKRKRYAKISIEISLYNYKLYINFALDKAR